VQPLGGEKTVFIFYLNAKKSPGRVKATPGQADDARSKTDGGERTTDEGRWTWENIESRISNKE